jgi:hypothetical protein
MRSWINSAAPPLENGRPRPAARNTRQARRGRPAGQRAARGASHDSSHDMHVPPPLPPVQSGHVSSLLPYKVDASFRTKWTPHTTCTFSMRLCSSCSMRGFGRGTWRDLLRTKSRKCTPSPCGRGGSGQATAGRAVVGMVRRVGVALLIESISEYQVRERGGGLVKPLRAAPSCPRCTTRRSPRGRHCACRRRGRGGRGSPSGRCRTASGFPWSSAARAPAESKVVQRGGGERERERERDACRMRPHAAAPNPSARCSAAQLAAVAHLQRDEHRTQLVLWVFEEAHQVLRGAPYAPPARASDCQRRVGGALREGCGVMRSY